MGDPIFSQNDFKPGVIEEKIKELEKYLNNANDSLAELEQEQALFNSLSSEKAAYTDKLAQFAEKKQRDA